MDAQEIRRQTVIEDNKLLFEAMKHLTTLSTGSILLLVTFLDRLFTTNREWLGLVAVALVGFMVSILTAVSSLIQISNLLTTFTVKPDEYVGSVKTSRGFIICSEITFLVGVVGLAIFALKNLY